MKFREYVTEGKFVKSVDDKVVKKVMGGFISKKLKEFKKTGIVDPDTGMEEEPSILKTQEYLEEFINALTSQGPMSHGSMKGNLTKSNMGTAPWAINIMKELGLNTSRPGDIKKFEEELTKECILAIRN